MKKKFEKPEAIVIEFADEDIITNSDWSQYDPIGDNGDED